jgi:hypothetical protein
MHLFCLFAKYSGIPNIIKENNPRLLFSLCCQGHVNDEENQDLRGFYLLSALCFIAINVLGVFFLGVYRKPEQLERST